MRTKAKKTMTKVRRSFRAISPVISVLLMIAVAVAAALVTYAWVMGYLGFTTNKVGKAIQIQSISSNAVYVQNVGDSPLTLSGVYVDGVLKVAPADYSINADGTDLDPSETATISFTAALPSTQVTVKVTTTDGTFTEYKKTFSGASAGGATPTPTPTVRYRKAITFSNTPGVIVGTQPNFPALISISGDTEIGGSTGGSGGSADGDHVYFTDTDGTTKLDHEIESFSVSGGAASMVAWVRVPSLTTGKVIYLYYGSDVPGGQQNPTGVWNTNYRSVYHLSEDPSGPSPQLKDSTGNNNDATSYGSMTTSDQVPAKADGGLDFDGSNDYLEAPHTSSLAITGSAITLSAWVNPQSTGTDQIIISKPYQSSSHSYPYFAYSIHLLGGTRPRIWITTSTGDKSVQSSVTIPYGSWSYITGVYTGSNLYIYVNGVQRGSISASGTINSYTTPLRIGTNGGFSEKYKSIMDEVRISSAAHLQDWITTEYNNMNNPNAFHGDISAISEEVV